MVYNILLSTNASTDENGQLIVACLALLVSVVAIVISVISLCQNKYLNTTNLQSLYFQEIFRDFFVNRIPDAVEEVKFEDNKLNRSYKVLNDTMMDMIEKSKYFAYAKHEFYIQMKNMAINLEDKLIETASKEVPNKDEQMKFIYEIHEDVMNIIKLINKNYHRF